MSDERPSRRFLPAFSLRTLLEVVFVCGVVFYLWFNRPPGNVIQPNHVLQIDVFGAPSSWQQIDGLYYVDPDGCVNLGAYYGKLPVARMTADEAQAALMVHLQKYMTGARATVSIAGWRSSRDGGQIEALTKEIDALRAEIGKNR
jgi:protein involved in polysaccharide export with SLBB domain